MKQFISIFLSFIFFSGILINPLVIPSAFGLDNSAYVIEHDDEILIGNNFIEISFDKTFVGGINHIIDKQTGIDLKPDDRPVPTLYLMFFDD